MVALAFHQKTGPTFLDSSQKIFFFFFWGGRGFLLLGPNYTFNGNLRHPANPKTKKQRNMVSQEIALFIFL